ncbi:hypothetical protein C8F01DRAFT_1231318 [Mycena amicta]|nr:hypothetical protein C8F01DRAFT_1231318 [Mycena amicta]
MASPSSRSLQLPILATTSGLLHSKLAPGLRHRLVSGATYRFSIGNAGKHPKHAASVFRARNPVYKLTKRMREICRAEALRRPSWVAERDVEGAEYRPRRCADCSSTLYEEASRIMPLRNRLGFLLNSG